MTLSQGYDTPLDNGQQSYEVLSKYKLPMNSYGLDTNLLCRQCDSDLGGMSFGGHDIPFDHGQLCEVSSSTKLPLKNYGPDKNFCYVCTMTLTYAK